MNFIFQFNNIKNEKKFWAEIKGAEEFLSEETMDLIRTLVSGG